MNDQSYTTVLSVERSPQEVFDAINDVRSWWNRNLEGASGAVGDEFVHHVEGIHRAQIAVTELVPGERVVWRVLDNWFSFIGDQREWKDTEIRFDIAGDDGTTEIRFTHVGLVPSDECYAVCETAWGHYIHNSLRRLIINGEGMPNSSPGEVDHRDDRVRDLKERSSA
jgi:uncharacterized protein YndB with AHSA1/START domain